VVRWPYGAVETAPIDERHIAAVAVRALSEASLAGADFVLTGPAALSHARQVAVIGEVPGEAAVGYPAYVTTAMADLTGAPARSFHGWVAAHGNEVS
jgi:uncharacterized protein YbjT (DUF2867 family)